MMDKDKSEFINFGELCSLMRQMNFKVMLIFVFHIAILRTLRDIDEGGLL